VSTTTFGWLVLAFPLLGTIVIGAGFKKLPGRSAGWIGTAAIGLAFVVLDCLACWGAAIMLDRERLIVGRRAPRHERTRSA